MPAFLAAIVARVAPYSWALYLAAALAIAGGSAWITHRVDTATLRELELANAKAQTKAVQAALEEQQRQDKASLESAVKEAKAQATIAAQTAVTTKEIPKHVSDTAHCITAGLVRVLNAGALGPDSASDSVPAGQPDDACAPVTARALAESIVANYGAARANAQQLTELQAWVRNTLAEPAQ